MSNTHYKISGNALELANAFGFLFPGEIFLIQALFQSLPEDITVVNLGAGVGTSALAMKEIHPKIDLTTIDISQESPFGGLQNEINAFKNAGMADLIPHQILGNSQYVWSEWNTPLDVLMIDADHSEDGLQRDIDGWLHFVKPGGYVLFHDYDSANWHGITDVIDRNMKTWGWAKVLWVDTLICFRNEIKPVSVSYGVDYAVPGSDVTVKVTGPVTDLKVRKARK